MRVIPTFLLAGLAVACSEKQDEAPAISEVPGKNSLSVDGDTSVEDTGDYEQPLDIDGDPFEPDSLEAVFFPEDGAPVWVLTAKQGTTWVKIENFSKFGGAEGPETRTLNQTEVNYRTCGVCVVLETDCSVHGDHAHCGATYMPEPGSRVTFDELGNGAGASWAGSVSPIRFVEVSMDESLNTTPIEGGDQIDLDGWSFDVVLQAG